MLHKYICRDVTVMTYISVTLKISLTDMLQMKRFHFFETFSNLNCFCPNLLHEVHSKSTLQRRFSVCTCVGLHSQNDYCLSPQCSFSLPSLNAGCGLCSARCFKQESCRAVAAFCLRGLSLLAWTCFLHFSLTVSFLSPFIPSLTTPAY